MLRHESLILKMIEDRMLENKCNTKWHFQYNGGLKQSLAGKVHTGTGCS